MKLQKLIDVLNETVKVEVEVDKELPKEVKRLYDGDVGHIPESSIVREAQVIEVWPKEDLLHIEVSLDYASIVLHIAEKLKEK